MRKTIITLLFIVLSVNFTEACKCEFNDDINRDYLNTEIIIRGKVLSKQFVTFSTTLDEKGLELVCESYQNDTRKLEYLDKDWILRIEMEITDTYKGDGLPKTVVIYTSRLSATCGYLNFEIDKEFQVYLSSICYFNHFYKKAKLDSQNYLGYWTSRCTRTKEFDLKEDSLLKSLAER